MTEDININEFLSKNIVTQEEYEKYYLLNSDSLTAMGLGELINKYSGYFIVNYEVYEVIYTNGYENSNGLWCYKLSELNKMPVVETPSANEVAQPENIVQPGNEAQPADAAQPENTTQQ